uniref:Uncharacterized protein n=1 Tax=Pararge aegeria TaxID=116150 RepID=S4P665_9NEOP
MVLEGHMVVIGIEHCHSRCQCMLRLGRPRTLFRLHKLLAYGDGRPHIVITPPLAAWATKCIKERKGSIAQLLNSLLPTCLPSMVIMGKPCPWERSLGQ